MSRKLQAVQIDQDTTIYVEAVGDVEVPPVIAEPEEQTRSGQKGWMDTPSEQIAQSFKAIETTIKTYTNHTLNAFRDVALADVEKVTLEFGVNLSGEGGIPYIATGTMGCNIKITVECAFPERKPKPTMHQAVPQHQPMHQAAHSAVPQSHANGSPQPIPRQPVPSQPLPNGTSRTANS